MTLSKTSLDNTLSPNGFILIERPHRGSIRTWNAYDPADLIKRCQLSRGWDAWADNNFNLEEKEAEGWTADDALEFLRHDLSSLTVLRYEDVDAAMLADANDDLRRALIDLDWAEETAGAA